MLLYYCSSVTKTLPCLLSDKLVVISSSIGGTKKGMQWRPSIQLILQPHWNSHFLLLHMIASLSYQSYQCSPRDFSLPTGRDEASHFSSLCVMSERVCQRKTHNFRRERAGRQWKSKRNAFTSAYLSLTWLSCCCLSHVRSLCICLYGKPHFSQRSPTVITISCCLSSSYVVTPFKLSFLFHPLRSPSSVNLLYITVLYWLYWLQLLPLFDVMDEKDQLEDNHVSKMRQMYSVLFLLNVFFTKWTSRMDCSLSAKMIWYSLPSFFVV